MKPQVRALGNHTFQLLWNNSQVVVDVSFARFVNQCNLTEHFVLQHYQAKPVGQRTFAYYDGKNYYTVYDHEVEHFVICNPLSIEDSIDYRPTSVNYFANAKITQSYEKIQIVSAL